MTTLRRFTCDDLFTFNPVNLDFFTETVRRQAVSAVVRWRLRLLMFAIFGMCASCVESHNTQLV